jgi:hypothetical protein
MLITTDTPLSVKTFYEGCLESEVRTLVRFQVLTAASMRANKLPLKKEKGASMWTMTASGVHVVWFLCELYYIMTTKLETWSTCGVTRLLHGKGLRPATIHEDLEDKHHSGRQRLSNNYGNYCIYSTVSRPFFFIFHSPKMPLGLESVSFIRSQYCRYWLPAEREHIHHKRAVWA